MNRIHAIRFIDNENKVIKWIFKNDFDFLEFDKKFFVGPEYLDLLHLCIPKGDYKSKQAAAIQLAKDIQNFLIAECDIDISWNELHIIQEYFEKIGRQYGLTKEFRNEGII